MERRRAPPPPRGGIRGQIAASALLLCCFSSQPGLAQANGSAFDQAFADLADPAVKPRIDQLRSAHPLERGMASYYADRFHGRRTASGEAYDRTALTAAHPTLPLGSMVRVTNPRTGKWVDVRINDRGPFTGGRIIDLSHAAAEEIGIIRSGHALVELALPEGGAP